MEPVDAGANTPDANDDSLILQGADPGSAAGKLLNLFLTARFARRNQDTIWMTAFRNVRGRYGSEVTLAEGWSRAFVSMTSPKVQTAAAIINDVILPQGKDIYNIETTPEPYMPEFTEFLAQQNAEQGINADFKTFKNQIFLESQRRCANLASKVRDGFAETDFRGIMQDVNYDVAQYGSGCLTGPFPTYRYRKARKGRKAGKYLFPEFRYASIFDQYPDPGARSVEDCLYWCERMVKNKGWLSKMRTLGGFMKDRIDYVIEHAPDGNWTPEPWETDMIMANNNNQMYTYRHRYIIYNFWIQNTASELVELGVSEDELDMSDPNRVFMANIMVCNAQVIRAVVSEFHEGRVPYYIGQCRKNTHSIWATGIPEMMFDTQAAGSACERAANDTMASIARPQVVIDITRCKMGSNNTHPAPGKEWYVNNSTGGASKPIDIFYPPNILKEIMERQDSLKAWADEQTGVPRFLSGDGQGAHNRTLGGAELQWTNANNPFKTIVANIEKFVLVPCVDKVVEFYMTYQFSDEIDADYKIVTTGLQGLIAKTTRVTNIMELLKAVGNNEYWQAKVNDKRVGEILEDAFSLTGEQLFLNDVDAEAKMKRLQELKAQTPPPTDPGIPLRDAKLKALALTDKGTPAYPMALEAVYDDLGMEGPATAAALNIMRTESLTAHRQFTSGADAQALNQDVNPDGSGKDIPDQMQPGQQTDTGSVPWQPGQPGPIPPQQAPQAVDGKGIIQAPLPLGVSSLGTPKAESLVAHSERYSTSIPPGRATNVADVGGLGLPGGGQ